MTKYERIIPLKGVPFAQTIMDYQEQFIGRDIYVSNKMYLSLLKFVRFKHDLTSDNMKNTATKSRIHRSYRVPDYVAYAIKRIKE